MEANNDQHTYIHIHRQNKTTAKILSSETETNYNWSGTENMHGAASSLHF